jgi:phosphate:Na+ symporter
MNILIIGTLLGGVGLFLLGMILLTDGLKLAAGKTLKKILESSAKTPLRGILFGTLITSIVQSSGIVTVAVIGFVNAGLMSLGQAITIIYGTNIGTTMTSWLVAIIGFKLNIKAFAMPLIGLGMMQRLIYGPGRQGAFGEALAGFGIFFLGIDVLKSGFEGLGSGIHLAWQGHGALSILFYLALGFLLTVIMQSSSAAIAITLTAAAGGVIAMESAAVLVIGANIGSTSTAGLAVLGATPNAKRVAAAHVTFNVITGIVALCLLPLLLKFLSTIQSFIGHDAGPVTILAMFHTLFNVLGVIILWPLTNLMIRRLKRLFRSTEEDEAKPVYLDRNVISTPVLAMHALEKELERLGNIARRMAKGALSTEISRSPQFAKDTLIFDQLETAVIEFVNLMQRSHLPAYLDEALPNGLRIAGYYAAVTELAIMIIDKQPDILPLGQENIAEKLNHFKGSIVKMLKVADVSLQEFNPATSEESLKIIIDEYHTLKSMLLRAGTQGFLNVRQIVALLDLISYMRRMAEQAAKAARYLTGLTKFALEESLSEQKKEPPEGGHSPGKP